MAVQAPWSQTTWAPRLGLLLMGEAQKDYSGILLADTTNYKVKEAIFHHLEVAKELHCQRCHGKKAFGAGSLWRLVHLLQNEVQQ